jgi:choline kinase
MKAIMLAAGVGVRMGGNPNTPPKVMLSFGGRTLLERHIEILRDFGVDELVVGTGFRAEGRTLLERHIEILRDFGVDELVVGTGFRAETIEREIARLGARGFVRTVFNPRYTEGSLLTMLALRGPMADGDEVLFMDGDVLYDHRLMAPLVDGRHANGFLIDRDFEPGDEPVKLCIRDQTIVDFNKKVGAIPFDFCGESVGFFRFAPAIAEAILAAGQVYADAGRGDLWYEEAIRDVVLEQPDRFGYADITGLPWIEIDFPEDVRRAENQVLPRLKEPVEA